MAFEPTTAQELRIGLYIKIEGSWFSHPFSVNTFKIKYQKELETLRGLRRVKLLFDPDKSDPEGLCSEDILSEDSNGITREVDTQLRQILKDSLNSKMRPQKQSAGPSQTSYPSHRKKAQSVMKTVQCLLPVPSRV